MTNKRIYAVTGIFEKPDEIIHAAEKVAYEGYRNYDIHTPYPVHGMDKAMRLPPSTMGYFALVLGLTGAAVALFFMWITTAYEYPLVIGGKPFYSLPALIPITFEVSVLSATIGTVISMLFIFFKLPNNSHPLHDTKFMKQVSSDKFGVCIEAKDKFFETEKVKSFLLSLGAKEVEEIYFDLADRTHRHKILAPKFIGFLAFMIVLTSAITYVTLNIALYLPPFDWMVFQSRLNAQSTTDFYKDHSAMRKPVEGTIARDFMPYAFKGQPDSAAKYLENPLEITKTNLAVGKKKFNTFCSPCHDYFATGNSRLRGKFPNPPSLHTDKVRNWPDGRIYHIITEGQNVMPGYDKQITREQRWEIVLYVRALQRAFNAKEGDVQ